MVIPSVYLRQSKQLLLAVPDTSHLYVLPVVRRPDIQSTNVTVWFTPSAGMNSSVGSHWNEVYLNVSYWYVYSLHSPVRFLSIALYKMSGLNINSLAPGKFEWNFRHLIFKQILVIDGWGIWNCPNVNVTGLHWWSVNIDSGNGLVPSGNKP